MGQNVPVFFTKPAGIERVSLRRYRGSYEGGSCPHPGNWGYHNAEFFLGEMPERLDRSKPFDSGRGYYGAPWEVEEFADNPNWPARCACGYEFTDKDHRQIFTDDVMIRADGLGGKYSRRHAPVGMMWDAAWWQPRHKSVNGGVGWINVGPDGLTLVVAVPSQDCKGQWSTTDFMPEMRASNCDRKDDGEHHCWVRHGDARKNECHIDKNGLTCNAGAGSIVTNGWHGFIHHGFVTDVPDILVR